MSTWHHTTCRKADVAAVDGIPTCKSCGSAYIRRQTRNFCELRVAVSCDQNIPGELKLTWPSTITFSHPESLPVNSEMRRLLEKLAVNRGQELSQSQYMRGKPSEVDENVSANGICFRSIDALSHRGCDTRDSHSTENLYHDDFDADDNCFIELLQEDFHGEVGGLMDILALDLKNHIHRPIDKRLRRKQKVKKCINRRNIPPLSEFGFQHQSGMQRSAVQIPWPRPSRIQSKQVPGARDDVHLRSEDRVRKLDVKYESLAGKDRIRLLYLSPSFDKVEHEGSSQAKPLHGHLRHADLIERPIFTAVSYTWASESGDREMSETIFLGDTWEPLAITSNCAGALRQLRHSTETQVLWIDAVCINQLDEVEKTHQVGLMRDIYSKADLVKIYLGWDGKYMPVKGDPKRVRDSLFCEGNTARLTQADCDDVKALFARRYWTRLWVVQEVFLSKEAVVLIGSSTIPLSSILRTAFKSYFPSWISLAQSSRARRISPLGNAESLLGLLFTTSFCEATDPRDRVFALLGLVQGAKMEGLVTDYSRTAAEIYVGLTAYFLIKHRQFGLLALAAVENRSPISMEDVTGRRFATERPSWAPTWDYSLRSGPFFVEQQLVKCCIDHWSTQKFTRFKVHETLKSAETRVMRALVEIVTPASHSRGISVCTDDVDYVPQVFQGSGALLIHAHCVLDLDMALDGGGFVIERPGVGLTLRHQSTPLGWRLHVLSDSASIEREDRFVEIPGCDNFLHLKPVGAVPGVYRIASICLVALVANKHPGLVPSLQGLSISSVCALHRLLARLVTFVSKDLQFLQEWMLEMRSNEWLLPALAGKRTRPLTQVLSAIEMNQYQQWLISIAQYPNSILGPGHSPHDLDETFEKLSAYLDEWQDVSLWRRICGLLGAVDWQQYLVFLTETRSRLAQNFLDGSIRGDVETYDLYRHVVKRKLDQLLIDVSGFLPSEGAQLYLGDLGLSDAVEEVCSGDGIDIHRNMLPWADETDDAISGSWMKLESFLRHMLRYQGGSKEMLDKFTQRQVLRLLYTRCESREYLIR